MKYRSSQPRRFAVGISCAISLLWPVLTCSSELEGLTLVQAIEILQKNGLPILYSSDIVKPWMRVREEPAGNDARTRLSQILAPHDLVVRDGPQATLLIVRGKASSPANATTEAEPNPAKIALPTLNEMVVTASQYELTRDPEPAAAILSAADLDFIPNPGDDPLRAAARLPGTANADYTAKSNVRGGETDEILIRFDGLRLYDPFHLKDFQSVFSAIDPGITHQMNVYTGGFPSMYGNRMSSVIEITSLPADTEPYREVSLSFFNAAAMAKGGFNHGQGDWLVSVRRGTLDLFFDIVNSDLGDPSYLDVHAHVGHWFTDTFAVSANFLLFDDDITLFESKQREEHATADYRDAYGWLRFDFVPHRNLSGNVIWARTELQSSRDGGTDQPGVATGVLHETKEFFIDSLQTDWLWQIYDRLDLRFGASAVRSDGTYRYTDQADFALLFLTPGATLSPTRMTNITRDVDGQYYGGYLNARYRLTRKVVAEAGLRWDKETVSPGNPDNFSPRLAILYSPGEKTQLRASWGRYYQAEAINELQVSDRVTTFSPPQRADHVVLGLDQQLTTDIALRIEAYHKQYDRLRPRYENFLNPLVLLPELKPDRVRVAPDNSMARGIETTLRYTGTRPWSCWVSYAWASVKDNFSDTTARRAWDQTHSIRLGGGWRDERWELSAVGSFHTGWPTTSVALATSDPLPLVATQPRNARRLGNYTSIDIRAARTLRFSETNSLTLFVEIINLFNTPNDCCVEYEVDDETGTLVLETERTDSLPFVPSAGFVWRF